VYGAPATYTQASFADDLWRLHDLASYAEGSPVTEVMQYRLLPGVDFDYGESVPVRWRITVNVMDVARALGLVDDQPTGTVDEADVLSGLAELAEVDPENDDLFSDAAERVRRARSAGVETIDASSRGMFGRDVSTIQLRYRSEMTDIFTDLAIDVGLRHHRQLAEASI